MDVYDDGKRIVGPDRAVSQNPDRFCAKRILDVDLARRDVGQVRYQNRAQQRERIGATLCQGFGGQRHLWRQRERIAQFGVDKSMVLMVGSRVSLGRSKTVWQRLPGGKSAWISHIDEQAGHRVPPKDGGPSMVDSPAAFSVLSTP